MKRVVRCGLAAMLSFAAALTITAQEHQIGVVETDARAAAIRERLIAGQPRIELLNTVPIPNTHECTIRPSSCNTTIFSTVNIYGCRTDDFFYYNIHRLTVAANTRVTVNGTSSQFRPFLVIFTETPVDTVGSDLKPIGATASVTFTNTSSAPRNYLVTMGPGDDLDVGDYSLSITCAPAPTGSCVSDATHACMLNNRFRVSVRYRAGFDNNTPDSNASVKQVSGFANPTFETAFFFFNNGDNIELMVKVLDQGNTNSQGQPTIAVLFGSATPLRIELTVFDTQKQTTKTYTSAFGTMQGATDFTAFVK